MTSFSVETARLRLRPYTVEAAEQVADGTPRRSDWSPGYPRADDRDVARLFLSSPPAEPLFGPLQILLADDEVVIGGIGFFGPPDETGTVEMGYGVAPEAEGCGYATEALRALLHHGFADARVRRVLADTAHDNVASQRVLEKAGLRRTSSDENLHYYAIEG
ncbi:MULTISPECIES: GNAT family N-acetyltransferase [Streptomyces]|uniref:GNAT family N-acetyltransferase n=1 Tax=Streptomyces TaxID=1883 RepID=UPI0007809A45|nr:MULTISPECIES: GNAT family N-acetyltransferase [Streptomyces]MDN3058931.1 GNAT family N-acetyltransferase [Streptomyces sp. SRF1]